MFSAEQLDRERTVLVGGQFVVESNAMTMPRCVAWFRRLLPVQHRDQATREIGGSWLGTHQQGQDRAAGTVRNDV
jgi:hypothetical protein